MEKERHTIGYLQKESKKMVEDFQSKQELDFGAFDSELQGWEYTIPEGYTAEIKDGKVTVRKAKSEDERIREAIIHYFNTELLASEDERDKEILKKWIAYLERQKEQKQQVKCVHPEEYPITPEECINPAETPDYSGLNKFERVILRGFLAAGVENVPVGIIKDTATECIAFIACVEQESAEWSEEDEKMLRRAINGLHNDIYPKEREWLANRLKYLCPQPHWKLSDSILQSLYNASVGAKLLTEDKNNLYKLYLTLTKKLIQTNWKPSEEHMKTIWLAIQVLNSSGHNSLCCKLNALRDDLLKLK